ncbi:hypothetical protein ACFQGE_03835 [Halomicroarcula sp. GCM10025817]
MEVAVSGAGTRGTEAVAIARALGSNKGERTATSSTERGGR